MIVRLSVDLITKDSKSDCISHVRKPRIQPRTHENNSLSRDNGVTQHPRLRCSGEDRGPRRTAANSHTKPQQEKQQPSTIFTMADTATKEKDDASASVATATTAEEADSITKLTNMFHETTIEDGGKKKSIWADGHHHETDDTTTSLDDGLVALNNLVLEQKVKHAKWEFPVTPLQEFNATLDDLFRAFLRWSNKVEEDVVAAGEAQSPPLYNVSKAFRRLESYATWMHDNAKDLHEPLTVESVAATHELWKMKVTHDQHGRLLWWIDMGAMNFKAIKAAATTDHQQTLRYLVWQTHLVMFDEQAQRHGMVFVESLAKKGMWECFGIVPMDVSAKLDRLTIGSMPVKMKKIYMFDAAQWLHIVNALMRPFLSAKMRSRLVCPTAKDEPPQAICDREFGRASIPHGFAGMVGGTMKDLIETKYIKSETFA
jgi:rubrerythrin